MIFYITDENFRATRDAKDRLFTCSDIDEAEDTISFYFDMSYGTEFNIHDGHGNVVRVLNYDPETCETTIKDMTER